MLPGPRGPFKAWDVGILFRIRPGSQRPDDPRENEKF
jgi:hypothetical protein